MITFTRDSNLLEAETEALVNTVNTVGVMGKGIALMFKERFPENFRLYAAACKEGEVRTGRVFVTEVRELTGPRWIINFPTKRHWRAASRLEWVADGLRDLRRFLIDNRVRSVAIPPLGSGNGGLYWTDVRALIETELRELDIDILVFEPSGNYLNVPKAAGVQKLTPARALIVELLRRYSVLGMECSLLEMQKLAWFMKRAVELHGLENRALDLPFEPSVYGPYAHSLQHLLNDLDGSYLHCEKRIADAGPFEPIWFDVDRQEALQRYLDDEARGYGLALERVVTLIDGFESPFGMELLATVHWLLDQDGIAPNVSAVREGLRGWSGGRGAAERKNRLFDDGVVTIALDRLTSRSLAPSSSEPR